MSTLSDLIVEIADEGQPLKHTRLLQLSDLDGEQTVELRGDWASIPSNRKREVVGRLAELAEDNLELDFAPIFLIGLEDADEGVRERSVHALWECEDRSIIRPLADLIVKDPSVAVRTAAAISLGKFAELAQHGKLIPRDSRRTQDALLAAIDNPEEDVEVRRRALEAVACFDQPRIDEIIRDAYQGSDPALRQSSIYAMGRTSNARWLPIVLSGLDHESAEVRFEAAGALGLLGDESMASELVSLLDDDDSEVQNAAAQALGSIGGPLAKQALEQCLEAGDESLQDAAREALENMEFSEDPLGFRTRT